MQRLALVSLLLLFSGQLRAADDAGLAHPTATEWKEEANGDGLVIYSRTRDGSNLKEFKSVGTIDALSSSVFAVLNDVEAYPGFMPYTSECSVLKRAGDCTIAYQRLALPLVSDRDYTLRSEHSKTPGSNGPIYRIQWEPANDLGPPEKPGVQRVNVCEGGWLIEPDGAGRPARPILSTPIAAERFRRSLPTAAVGRRSEKCSPPSARQYASQSTPGRRIECRPMRLRDYAFPPKVT